MRLGLQLSHGAGAKPEPEQLRALEDAGLQAVFAPEAYGFDAVSLLGYLAACTRSMTIESAVLQIYPRSPRLTAATAAGLDFLSDGRFVLGLGTSGPQVIEGFHGIEFDAPLGRTREVVDICRATWRREAVQYDGAHYQIPLPPGRGRGLGKPLHIAGHPVRERIPIAIGAIGPRNVALAAEIADAWIPAFLDPERVPQAFGEALAAGAKRRSADLAPLEIHAGVAAYVGTDCDAALAQARARVTLYLGGMGARGANFYNDLAVRYGYGDAAERVQKLYLAGDRAAAVAAVPLDLVRNLSLIGDKGYVRERLSAFAECGVTTLALNPVGPAHTDPVPLVEDIAGLLS